MDLFEAKQELIEHGYIICEWDDTTRSWNHVNDEDDMAKFSRRMKNPSKADLYNAKRGRPLDTPVPAGFEDEAEPDKETRLSLEEFYNRIASEFSDFDAQQVGSDLVMSDGENEIELSYSDADKELTVKINGKTPSRMPAFAIARFNEFNALNVVHEIKENLF